MCYLKKKVIVFVGWSDSISDVTCDRTVKPVFEKLSTPENSGTQEPSTNQTFGCASQMELSFVSVVAMAGIAVIALKKRKESEQ